MKVLFVCEGNRHRSPTAAKLYSTTPGVEARSAGLSPLARVELTDELLAWSDVVFVMEARLEKLIRRQFAAEVGEKKIVGLAIPDDYQFMQPELIAILTERLTPQLGAPG